MTILNTCSTRFWLECGCFIKTSFISIMLPEAAELVLSATFLIKWEVLIAADEEDGLSIGIAA